MKLLRQIQDRFGFTRSEIAVILFLSSTFLAGLGVRWYNSSVSQKSAPGFDYSRIDSIFAARSRLQADPGPADGHQTERTSPQKLLSPGTHININAAGKEELMKLPGIGPALAGRIIEYRTQTRPFRSVDDLEHVNGIGSKKLQRLRPFVVAR